MLRSRRFYSEANEAIGALAARINERLSRERAGSRGFQVAEFDDLALKPLPAEPFDPAD